MLKVGFAAMEDGIKILVRDVNKPMPDCDEVISPYYATIEGALHRIARTIQTFRAVNGIRKFVIDVQEE